MSCAQSSGPTMASGMQDLTHTTQGASLAGHMSCSPLGGLQQDKRPPTNIIQHLHDFSDTIPQTISSGTGSCNPQRFSAQPPLWTLPDLLSLNLGGPPQVPTPNHLDSIGVKSTLARYLRHYVGPTLIDAGSCRSRVQSFETSMGRKSRVQARSSPTARASRQHRRERHIVDNLQCSICHDRFTNDDELHHHARSHDVRSTRDHRCEEPDCSKTFQYLKDLTRHMRTHGPATSISCPHCSKSFAGGRSDNLRRHIRDKHQTATAPDVAFEKSNTDSALCAPSPRPGSKLYSPWVKISPSNQTGGSWVNLVKPRSKQLTDTDLVCSSPEAAVSIEPEAERSSTVAMDCTTAEVNSSIEDHAQRNTANGDLQSDRYDLFRFSELSGVVRELQGRVYRMLSSTRLEDTCHDRVSREGARLSRSQSTPPTRSIMIPDGNGFHDTIGSEPLQRRFSDILLSSSNGVRSRAGSPSSSPRSSNEVPASGVSGIASTSSRKRKADSFSRRDNAREDEDPNGGFQPNGVRQRLDDRARKERHRCFFVSQHPDTPPDFEYISQLLRHMKTHDFFACLRCMTRHCDEASLRQHNQLHHVKTCGKTSCKRERLALDMASVDCDHLTTSQQQWQQLHRMQAPATVPITEHDTLPVDWMSIDLAGGHFQMPPDFDFITVNENTSSGQGNSTSGHVDGPLLLRDKSQSALRAEPGTDHNPFTASPAPRPSQVSHSLGNHTTLPHNIWGNDAFQLETDVQILREKVSLLEQRLSLPKDRERDLELALQNVWQALVRSGSADAHAESPVWGIVRRFAPNILSTAFRADTAQPENSAMQHASMDADWEVVTASNRSAVMSAQLYSDSGIHL